MKYLLKSFGAFLILCSLVFLQGCSDKDVDMLKQMQQASKTLVDKNASDFKKLSKYVEDETSSGKYESLLSLYSTIVLSDYPDNEAVGDMVKQFNIDKTKSGTVWKGYIKENNDLSSDPRLKLLSLPDSKDIKSNKNSIITIYEDLKSFNSQLDPVVYDERFIDYVNTMANLSPKLSPVVVSQASKDETVGNQFVGNPQYGNWVKDSSGNEHWRFLETYMYLSFLNNMMFDRSYGYDYNRYRNNYGSGNFGYRLGRSSGYNYDNWRNNRSYSYYNDTYVDKYATKKEKSTYKRSQSNLTQKYSKTIKADTKVSKQMKEMSKSPKNSRFQSNLVKINSSTSYSNKSSSSKSSAFQSNLTSKSVKKTSRSVSVRRGK